MTFRLSPYGLASTGPSPVNRMMEDFASDFRDGVDVNLGVGYVNAKTIRVNFLAEAMESVSRNQEKHRQAFNYCGPAGSANLVSSLRRFPIYCEALERRGFEVLAVPEDDEGMGLAALERKLQQLGHRIDRVAFFYVVNG